MSVTPEKDPNYIYAHPYATLIADEYRMRGGYCIVRPGGTDDHLMLLTRGTALDRAFAMNALENICLRLCAAIRRKDTRPDAFIDTVNAFIREHLSERLTVARSFRTADRRARLQSMDGINRHSTTTQPSFVSNPRTISTQPSFIRDPTTPTQPCAKGFVRRGQTLLTHLHTHEGEVVLSVQGK